MHEVIPCIFFHLHFHAHTCDSPRGSCKVRLAVLDHCSRNGLLSQAAIARRLWRFINQSPKRKFNKIIWHKCCKTQEKKILVGNLSRRERGVCKTCLTCQRRAALARRILKTLESSWITHTYREFLLAQPLLSLPRNNRMCCIYKCLYVTRERERVALDFANMKFPWWCTTAIDDSIHTVQAKCLTYLLSSTSAAVALPLPLMLCSIVDYTLEHLWARPGNRWLVPLDMQHVARGDPSLYMHAV